MRGNKLLRAAAPALAALLVFAALGCGGKRSSSFVVGPTLGPNPPSVIGGTASGASSRGVPIADLAKYGPRIQKIMASPLWDAPLPAQTDPLSQADVPRPAKVTAAEVLSLRTVVDPRDPATRAKYAKGVAFVPVRGQTAINALGAYRRSDNPADPYGGTPFNDPSIYQPTYDYTTQPAPAFGRDTIPHDGFEDVINAAPVGTATASGYVFRGLPTLNRWFSENNVFACAQTWQVAGADVEVSYVETLGTSTSPTAHMVSGTNYLRFNSYAGLNPPGFKDWHYYDFYVAPISDESSPSASGSGLNTSATVQYFNVDRNDFPVGENALVRLVSSDDPLVHQLTVPSAGIASSVPVFGPIYQRWADEVDNVGDQPWKGKMGWPLQPPALMNSGAFGFTAKGAYRLFGQYFERGFIYWFDYAMPTTPGDTLAFLYTGTNVLAGDGELIQTDNGTVSYGPGGPLHLAAVASNSIRGRDYIGSVMASIGDFVTFRAFAYGGGGPTHYSDVIWNYRDGTVDWNSQPGSNYNSKRVSGHSYVQEGVYKPRAMVIQDNAADFYLGTNVAMADTALVRVGTITTTLPPCKLAIVRGFPATGPAGVTDADLNPIETDLATEGWSNTGDLTVFDSVPASASTLSTYRAVIWVFAGQNITQNAWPALSTSDQDVMRSYVNDQANRHNLFIFGSTVLGTMYNPGWWTGAGYLYWDTDFYENYIGINARAGIMIPYFPTAAHIHGGLGTTLPPYADGVYLDAGLYNGNEVTWSKPQYTWADDDFWMYRGSLTDPVWLCGCNRLPSGNDVVTFGSDWGNVHAYRPLTRHNLLRHILAATDSAIVPSGTAGNLLTDDDPRNDATNPSDAKIVAVYAYTSEPDGTWSGGAGLSSSNPGLVTTVPASPNNRRTVHYEAQVRVRPDDVYSGRFVYYRYVWTFGDNGAASVETNQQQPLHTYIGAVPGTNPPNNYGDPYFVTVVVKRPTAADPTQASYDSFQYIHNDGVTQAGVWVKIGGPVVLSIFDDGTDVTGPYTFDETDMGAPVLYKYRIAGGNPPYNSLAWYIDSTDSAPVAVTYGPPASGSKQIIVPVGRHVVYATVNDIDAPYPPTLATVQYPAVTVGRLPVAIVRSGLVGDDTPMYNALQAALTAVYGAAQPTLQQNTVTLSQLNDYRCIIWSYNDESFSRPLTGPETTPDTDTSKIKAYLDQGGYFLGYWGWASSYDEANGPWVTAAMQDAMSRWNWYMSWFTDGTIRMASGSPMASGPGGSISRIYVNQYKPVFRHALLVRLRRTEHHVADYGAQLRGRV